MDGDFMQGSEYDDYGTGDDYGMTDEELEAMAAEYAYDDKGYNDELLSETVGSELGSRHSDLSGYVPFDATLDPDQEIFEKEFQASLEKDAGPLHEPVKQEESVVSRPAVVNRDVPENGGIEDEIEGPDEGPEY